MTKSKTKLNKTRNPKLQKNGKRTSLNQILFRLDQINKKNPTTHSNTRECNIIKGGFLLNHNQTV